MIKKEINEETKKPGFFSFPERANSLTILIIILSYVVVGAIVSFLVSPNVNYTVIPDYEHQLYNEEISSYVRKTTSLTSSNDNITEKETVTIYFTKNNNNEEEYEINYQVSGLTLGDNIDYMYTGSRSTFVTLPMTHTVKSEVSIKDGGYKALFCKIRYCLSGSEEEKEYNFREDIITLSKKELNKIKNIENEFTEKFRFTKSIYSNEDSKKKTIIVNVTVLSEEKIYHLDFQSFFVTESGKIYPVVGFYGYYSTQNKIITGFTTFSNDIKIKYFVVKARYINSDGKVESFSSKEEIE